MNTPIADEAEVVSGMRPSPEELFMLEWGRETYKQTIPRLDAAIQRIITLATALLGGSIYLVNADTLPVAIRAVTMLAFLSSLSAAFIGTRFQRETVSLKDPYAIAEFKNKVIEWRDRWQWIATALLWGGLGLATVGVLLKLTGIA